MAYQKNKHDIGITDVGSAGAGTGITGLMLATQPDGSKAYREYDGKYLADQFFTGAPSQAYINPEEELILTQDDWRKGFGEDYYDDPKRYFASYGMDLRHKGMAIAGWTPTAVTLPSYSYVVPTAGSGWTSNDANAYDGQTATYAQYDNLPDAVWSAYYTLTIPSTEIDQIRVWWTTAGSGGPVSTTVDIDAYYSGAWNAVYDGVLTKGSYQSKALASAQTCTGIRIRVLGVDAAHTEDIYLHEFHARATSVLGAVVDFAEFNDELYIAAGNGVLVLNGAGTAFTFVSGGDYFEANITDLEPFTDDQLYIALGTSNDYWYMTTTPTFAVSTANFKQFQFFRTVHGATPTIYGNDAINKIRSTTAPTGAATWTGQTTVGSSFYNITGLIAWKGLLYIGKEDKPYYLDATPAIQDDLARELESALATTSGKNAWIWKNELYYPAGDQALLHSDGTTNTFINPSKYCTNLSAFSGQVFAGAGDEEWNYVIVENTSTTEVEVMATRIETVDSTTSRVWHPIGGITLKGCEACHISTKARKALWIASDDATDALYYLQLPTTYGDIVNDSNKNFKTGTYFETPWLHGGFRSEDKAWIKLTLTMGHAYNTNDYFTVHYKVLGGSYVSIGNFTGISATNMIQSRFIDTTNKPFSPMIKLKFTAVTGATSRTPILLNYDVRAVMYPTIRKIIHCVVRCTNEFINKQGQREPNQYDAIKDTLDNARDNAVWPVSIRDISGDTLNVKFLPVSQETARMLPIKMEKGREQERLYHLLMLEIPLS